MKLHFYIPPLKIFLLLFKIHPSWSSLHIWNLDASVHASKPFFHILIKPLSILHGFFVSQKPAVFLQSFFKELSGCQNFSNHFPDFKDFPCCLSKLWIPAVIHTWGSFRPSGSFPPDSICHCFKNLWPILLTADKATATLTKTSYIIPTDTLRFSSTMKWEQNVWMYFKGFKIKGFSFF